MQRPTIRIFGWMMEVLWYLFITCAVVQIGYYLMVFRKLAYYRVPTSVVLPSAEQPPVSLVICARNEAANLQQYLPAVLRQQYPTFEVVVVNDGSTDDTAAILSQYAEAYPHLRIVTVTSGPGNKKKALQQGIQAASYETILLTDADCQPVSDHWISHIVEAMTSEKELVLGYAPYPATAGFLNLFIRFETVYTAMQYLSFALIGMPYMGVGRNLAYRKSVFTRSQTWHKHADILSGDDDLLVNEHANTNNTAICLHPDSFVESKAKTTWRAWLHQKRRHSQAGHRYKAKHRMLLGLLFGSQVFFHIAFISLLLTGNDFVYILAVFAIRAVFQAVIYGKILSLLHESGLLKWLWICDFLMSAFFISLGFLSIFKVSEWQINLLNQVERKKTSNWYG